jgi:hypothetical protein
MCSSIQLKVLDPYSMDQLVTAQEAVDYNTWLSFYTILVSQQNMLKKSRSKILTGTP